MRLVAFMQAIRPNNSELPLFKKENIKLAVNGKAPHLDPLHTLTVGTIPRLSLGIRPFPPSTNQPGQFQFSANGMPLYKVAAFSPTLVFGLGDQSQLDFGPQLVCGNETQELVCELSEGFTMDGELFELAEPTQVRISAGPVVRFWTE